MYEPRPLVARGMLQQILETPHLAALVPTLRPEVLQRVIHTCGLEECGELLQLATADQIRQLADLDLWRPAQPGGVETFDADRFVAWLDVLVDMGPAVAARKLADMPRAVVTTGFAQHIRVFEHGTLSSFETTDGELIPDRAPEDQLSADLGGYLVIARRADGWDAIVSALLALESDQPACYVEIMRGVRSVSSSAPELDELDALLGAPDQLTYDAGTSRDERREALGYVTVGDARAFLESARRGHAEPLRVPSVPVIEPARTDMTERDPANASAPLLGILQAAGMIEPPRKLLPGRLADAPHLERLRRDMQILADSYPEIYAARTADIARLTNTLIAGCSLQGRSFTPEEARDAVLATCNLGLHRLDAPEGTLLHHGLVSIFQAGWTMLHDDVVMYAADELAGTLARLRRLDSLLQSEVDALRRDLVKHLRTGTPWQARRRMDVLANLDLPAWAALLGLIDECPVRHAAIAAARDRSTRGVSLSSFDFIAEPATVLEIRAFLQELPEMLAG